MRKLILLSSITTLGLSSIVTPNLVKDNTSTIQIAVLKSKDDFSSYLKKFERYDTLIEKINNYTLYIVNIDKKEKRKVLRDVRKSVKDAFFITKNFEKEDEVLLKKKVKQTTKKINFEKNEYKEALKEFKNKNFEKSYEMFSSLFINNMGDILINFYLGRSAYELKKYEMAISAYDRILISEPNNTRVKLELAQTYMQMSLFPQAMKEFEETLESKMPLQVRKKVEANIALIKTRQEKHFFNVTALLGLIYDSNINATPDTGAFDIYSPNLNATITLENNEEEVGTTIYQLATIASYKYKVNDNFVINNTFTPLLLKYNNHNEKDIQALSFNTSPTWFKKHSKSSLGFLFDYITLGHKSYQRNFYILPNYTRVLSPSLLFDFSVKAGMVTFNSEEEKDARVLEFQNYYKYLSEEYGTFSFGLKLGGEFKVKDIRTDVEQRYYNLFVANSYDFLSNYTLQTSLNFKNIRYSDMDVNFLTKRNDKKFDASISVQKQISKDMMINLGTTYTNNDSNHESSDYDKYSLKTNLFYSF